MVGDAVGRFWSDYCRAVRLDPATAHRVEPLDRGQPAPDDGFTIRCAADGAPLDIVRGSDAGEPVVAFPFARALRPPRPMLLAGLVPGALSDSAALQSLYYGQHHGFGVYFESGRLSDIGAFLARYDPAHDGVWLVLADGRVQGSIVIDGGSRADGPMQLRWFVLSDALRGRGFGRRLIDAALAFVDVRRRPAWLTTFAGLDAARALYEQRGFVCVDERLDSTWGVSTREQRFERPAR